MMNAQDPISTPSGPLAPIRKLYDWVLSWADTPYGLSALVLLSLIESIFFPIPPDVLLIALTLGARERWFRFALSCTVASVVGGMIGYYVGASMWGQLSESFYAYVPGFTEAKFAHIKELYDTYDFWIVFTAGFTPIPFKVITISAGACQINFGIFMIASLLSRGARFFLVSKLLHRYGEPMRTFIEERFNQLTLLATAALIGGFAVLKLLF